MFDDGNDMIHYVMLYNDNERQPAKPDGEAGLSVGLIDSLEMLMMLLR